MAGGWTRDGAVQEQIDDTVADAIQLARARMTSGEGETHCEECGEEFPEARRLALPSARTCVQCQSALDRKPVFSPFNRRGSKDSQLR
jgi:phage/conjugal plasmid C-4 type zinc finger TraR family protein